MVVDAPQRPLRRPQHTGAGLGLREWGRWLWNQLTSMRTALALLFLGALAAIPGSFVPQRSVSPAKVDQFIEENPQIGKLFDSIGMFSVYTSPWFSAIYLLLLISLVGCIVPRVGVYYRALRAQPPRAPRNLRRLPEYAAGELAVGPDEALDRAQESLRSKRFRVVRRDGQISAERGYLREAGNLVFHVSLVLVLVTLGIGVLWGFRGTSATVVGRGFSNNLSFYDDVTAGALFRTDQMAPFTVNVDDMTVTYSTEARNPGQPLYFRTDVTVTDHPGAPARQASIESNRPLEVDGVQVHMLGYGYAPIVTVTDGRGNVGFSGPVIFLPQDPSFTSAGVIKVPDAQPKRLAFQGFFLPTATVDQRGPRSLFPDAYSPEMFLNAWTGDPQPETGVPESIYQLNTADWEQLRSADGEPVRIRLKPGDYYDLPNGQGRIQFEGWTRWVRLQYSRTPAAVGTLIAIGLAVAGLCASLFVRPRRIWVRVVPKDAAVQADSSATEQDQTGQNQTGQHQTKVELAGLDRVGGRTGLSDELTSVLSSMQDADRKEST